MAITTQSLTVPAKEKTEQHCNCGCAPCGGTCCGLDCIVRPHFFCGQLLTDADLSSLLKWSRDRFGLSRYRHGWGVVCGLDVHCAADGANSVIVTPGYAVDCCGNDIIVCQKETLDLKDLCREEEDPCADLRPPVRRNGEGIPIKEDVDRMPAPTGPGLGGALEGSRVIDIYLSYEEKPSDPTTALGRSSCKQVAECEYSRTRESYKLTPKLGVAGVDPVRARAEKWHEGYGKCLDVLKEFRITFPQGFPPADVKKWLVRWIDAHPQYQLCGQRQKICDWTDQQFTERNLIQMLFELVQACRNAYLNCDCFGCDDNAGVPIARVWLMPDDRQRNQACRIIAIDSYPPYRRPIQPECWPAPLGSVNVGRFIWHRWTEVCRGTADLGMNVTKGTFTLPQRLVELEQALLCSLFVACDARPVVAQVYNAGFLDERVVGFCGQTAGPATPQPVCPEILVDGPAQFVPGEIITFATSFRGAAPSAAVTYNWEPTSGVIEGGQGTPRVRVNTQGVNESAIRVKVQIGGLDPACDNIAVVTSQRRANLTNFGGESELPRDATIVSPSVAVPAKAPEADDLISIKGIGKASDTILRDAGITSFASLASTPREKLKELFPRLNESVTTGWIEEAKTRVG